MGRSEGWQGTMNQTRAGQKERYDKPVAHVKL